MTATATTISGATTLAIDAAHSLVEFGVKHMMISTVKGRFGDVSGQLTIDENNIANSSVQVEIRTESVSTGD
ncbi:MAG: YceI family protein, partial [Thermomicrobiales bacterium]